jgi:hypothetical protein
LTLEFVFEVATVPDRGCEDNRERKVTKNGRMMKQDKRRTSRRGRMSVSDLT